MIYIIEGTDGVGKTTLAKRMAEELGCESVHAGPPKSVDWYEEYVLPLYVNGSEDIVLDRWHVGEMVWPQIFDRPSIFTAGSFEACNKLIGAMGARLIIITRDPEDIAVELLTRGESAADVDRSLAGQEEFLRLTDRSIRDIDLTLLDSNDAHERGLGCIWTY